MSFSAVRPVETRGPRISPTTQYSRITLLSHQVRRRSRPHSRRALYRPPRMSSSSPPIQLSSQFRAYLCGYQLLLKLASTHHVSDEDGDHAEK